MLLLLCLAALADLKTDRIPNGLIVLGIMIGVSDHLLYRLDLLQLAVSMLFAFAVMYPLFKIGALGAGDVKVFVMIGSFVDVKAFIMIIAAAFVIGAVFSLIKLLTEHNGRERIGYFLSYVSDVARTREWKIYGEYMLQDYQLYCSNKIHFTVPILFGAILRMGGII
ncbi:MAG: A24 family peptidase [Eubacterium sp.]|nr:A24 family peptidase [Eubacterium sp.]